MGWVICNPPFRAFWQSLPDESAARRFANAWFQYGQDEAFEHVESTYEVLTKAKTLDDLDGFEPLQWYITAKLLQSGMPLAPELLGSLLERVTDEACRIGRFDTLGVKPKRRGRPENRMALGLQLMRVSDLIKQGRPKSDAYQQVANELNKSSETVRRNFERHIKKHRGK